MLPDRHCSRLRDAEDHTVVYGDANHLSDHSQQTPLVTGDAPRQHVGITRRAADAQDRKQEAALEHEAIAVRGGGEPVEEAFEQVELEELLARR